MEFNNELIEKLNNMASRLGLEKDPKHFWIGQIKEKINLLHEQYPDDNVLRQMSAIVDNMFKKDHLQTVQASALRSMFNQIDNAPTVGSSRWRELLVDFLPATKQSPVTQVNPASKENFADYRGDLQHIANLNQGNTPVYDDNAEPALMIEDDLVSSSELKREIYKQALNKNYKRCEDLIATLQSRLSPQEFCTVFASYSKLLHRSCDNQSVKMSEVPIGRGVGIATYSPSNLSRDSEPFDKELLETDTDIALHDIRLT